jgi:hypothetical protein
VKRPAAPDKGARPASLPPAAFSILVEAMAQEMIANGIAPGTPHYESFIRMQVAALMDRTRGICLELGVDVDEEMEEVPAPARWFPWWRRS